MNNTTLILLLITITNITLLILMNRASIPKQHLKVINCKDNPVLHYGPDDLYVYKEKTK